jgi:hypothetical protein
MDNATQGITTFFDEELFQTGPTYTLAIYYPTPTARIVKPFRVVSQALSSRPLTQETTARSQTISYGICDA